MYQTFIVGVCILYQMPICYRENSHSDNLTLLLFTLFPRECFCSNVVNCLLKYNYIISCLPFPPSNSFYILSFYTVPHSLYPYPVNDKHIHAHKYNLLSLINDVCVCIISRLTTRYWITNYAKSQVGLLHKELQALSQN